MECGCDFIDILEINHIKGGGRKEDRESKASNRGKGFWLAIVMGRRITDDLDILCKVCNANHYVRLIYQYYNIIVQHKAV